MPGAKEHRRIAPLLALAGRARAACWAILVVAVASCSSAAPIRTLSGATMGTGWTVKLVAAPGHRLDDIERRIVAELDRIVGQMSTWEADSAISRYNASAPDSWHDLPDDFHRVLAYALELARATDGAYDPTVGALVNLWGFGPTGVRTLPPERAEIDAMRPLAGWRRVTLDERARRVLQPGGVQLDLSSVAKGYAVDRIAAVLDRAGIADYLVEIGGELRLRGRRPEGGRWRVAVETPRPGARDAVRVLAVDDIAIATSGDYRSHFESAGRRYSHIIDPRTGVPVDHALVSVTVLHPDCMHADALATALIVLGPVEGPAFARRHDLAALFIERRDTGFVLHSTSAFDALVAQPR